ncbi:hypothetical protein F511_21852 [Dorcoceras hygrometricum]|uniref:Uncharacterized protein n=1 Tax=Dorcoceras hygrometricum TaxID=472368 RepID=A0A2Z7B6E4_9LAMI|nr:hypothetical protein F511_21852 [Dorcoceras hygrometricum]
MDDPDARDKATSYRKKYPVASYCSLADGFALKVQQMLFAMCLIYPVVGKSSRKHLKPTTGQPAASISSPAQPVASYSASSRRKTRRRNETDVVRICTRKRDLYFTDGISSSRRSEQVQRRRQRTAAAAREGAAAVSGRRGGREAATRVVKCRVCHANPRSLCLHVVTLLLRNNSCYPCPINSALSYLLSCTHTKQDNSPINSGE